MNPKHTLLIFSVVIGAGLGLYIMEEESKPVTHQSTDPHAGHNHPPEVKVSNQGEPKVSLRDGFEQIGMLQGVIPSDWKREQPSSSMRIAQFALPGEAGVGELIAFSGIGGSVDANLERWYGQFKPEGDISVADGALKKHLHVNGMEATISYASGTYLKSSMGMGGTQTEMKNYVLMAAIIIAPDGPYYFKGTGPAQTMNNQKQAFEKFVNSIEPL